MAVLVSFSRYQKLFSGSNMPFKYFLLELCRNNVSMHGLTIICQDSGILCELKKFYRTSIQSASF